MTDKLIRITTAPAAAAVAAASQLPPPGFLSGNGGLRGFSRQAGSSGSAKPGKAQHSWAVPGPSR